MKVELEMKKTEALFLFLVSIVVAVTMLASQYGNIVLGWFADYS